MCSRVSSWLPSFRWTEAPRWLPLTGESLGAVFNQFMHTNLFETPSLNFKAPPQFILPVANISSGLPTNSTLQVSHGLDAAVGSLGRPNSIVRRFEFSDDQFPRDRSAG